MFLSVLVPVFNEASTLERALGGLFRELSVLNSANYQVIVIESSSSDGSGLILTNLQNNFDFQLITEHEAMGKGHAVRTGLAVAKGEWILIFDADLEYQPQDLHKLIAIAKTDSFDFIIGSRRSNTFMVRDLDGKKLRSFLMNFAHVVFTSMINSVIKTSLKDPFSMYKLFRKSLFAETELKSNRFDLDWELILIAGRLKARFVEIEITYKSRGFSEGKKIKFFRDPINWFWAWLKYSFIPIALKRNE